MCHTLLSEGIKDIDRRCATRKLDNDVGNEVHDRKTAIDEHRQRYGGVHVTTTEATYEEDDKGKCKTDDERVAGCEDTD